MAQLIISSLTTLLVLGSQYVYGQTIHEPVQMCSNNENDIFIPDIGSESSLSIDFRPNASNVVCNRKFYAPDGFGFYIKFYRLSKTMMMVDKRAQKLHRLPPATVFKNNYSCPLNIFSSNDSLSPPWRLDPCKLEMSNIFEEPVRLLQGRVKLVWNHNQNSPAYRMVITVVGKGFLCQDESKFACLKIGFEPILCIAKDLVCDGVKQCPLGSEMYSDEDPSVCMNQPGIDQHDMTIWHQLSLGFLKNMFGINEHHQPGNPYQNFPVAEHPVPPTSPPPRPVPPPNVTRGLARYGPWGYLMLGMLLCGAALLVCGLWECCCRLRKPDREDSLSSLDIPSSPVLTRNRSPGPSAPPNYEEIDPPPSYTTLFPLNKSDDNLSVLTPLPQGITTSDDATQ